MSNSVEVGRHSSFGGCGVGETPQAQFLKALEGRPTDASSRQELRGFLKAARDSGIDWQNPQQCEAVHTAVRGLLRIGAAE